MPDFQYVDSSQALLTLCQGLRDAKAVALDTEFMRERTYFARLALVQLAHDDTVALIDPVAIDDLAPLAALLARSDCEIVMHSAGEDIEVLTQARLPLTRLFDTQVANALLGGPPQLGLAGLVHQEHAIDLPKGATRTNWLKRPLSDAQLEYAADDVRYLLPIFERQQTRLVVAGRKDWMAQEMRALLLSRREMPAATPPKAANRLMGDAWQRAVQLAAWREAVAAKRDKPRRWILSDAELTALAAQVPTDHHSFMQVADWHQGFVRRHRDELLRMLASPQTENAAEPIRLEAPERAQLKQAQAELANRAQALGLEPTVVASRADLSAALFAVPTPLPAWRQALVDQTVAAIKAA